MDVVGADRFSEGMRQLAAGVCIVATRLGERRYGLTATAVCSLSAEPPALLVCVSHSAEAHNAICEAERVSIQVLSESQIDVAQRFSSVKGEQKFEEAPWSEHTSGMPHLLDALASFDCRVVETWQCETHSVFKCLVERLAASDGPPLVYRNRQFSGVVAL
jgi:flavin reductase (DIM6/NTAB) family NADH-FMN oxidoreductase RutF